jgi:hypothetical protein
MKKRVLVFRIVGQRPALLSNGVSGDKKNPFIPWINILTIRNAKFTFGHTLPIATITVGILPEEGFVILIL